MLDFTFLTEEQIFGFETYMYRENSLSGDCFTLNSFESGYLGYNKIGRISSYNKQLDILKKIGSECYMTDFSLLLGGERQIFGRLCDVDHDVIKSQYGNWWTKTSDAVYHKVRVIKDYSRFWNDHGYECAISRSIGARPALSYSSISNICSDKVIGENGILEVEYGEYPQEAAPKRLQDELETAYNNNLSSIRKTGKIYTIDSQLSESFEKFSAQSIEEYSFIDGKKYVRVEANLYSISSEYPLSNGESYKNGDYVWVEVQPIKWLVDEKKDIALSEKILFAGIQFDNSNRYCQNNFDRTDIKRFMDEFFSKDIMPSTLLKEGASVNQESKREVLKEEVLIPSLNKKTKPYKGFVNNPYVNQLAKLVKMLNLSDIEEEDELGGKTLKKIMK